MNIKKGYNINNKMSYTASVAKTIMWIFLTLVLLFLIVRSLVKISGKYSMVKKSYNEVHERYIAQKDRLTSLEEEVMYLRTPRGKEDKIRERYRVVSPGEKIILVVEGK